jgi:hypothetical protein
VSTSLPISTLWRAFSTRTGNLFSLLIRFSLRRLSHPSSVTVRAPILPLKFAFLFEIYEKYGLIPNMFPEGENTGRYNTADATLWYFHAIERYLLATGDRDTLLQ